MKPLRTFPVLPLLAALMTGISSVACAAEGKSSSGGFPQLDVSSYPGQVFWLVVFFLLLYFLMAKVALPRVTDVLEFRRAQKGSTLEKAGQLSEEAEKVKTAYEKALAQAQKTAAEALLSTERAVSEKIAEEQSRFAENSRKRLVTAEQGIAKAKTEALHSLADIAAEIAAEMANKIADIQASKAEAKKAVLSLMQKG